MSFHTLSDKKMILKRCSNCRSLTYDMKCNKECKSVYMSIEPTTDINRLTYLFDKLKQEVDELKEKKEINDKVSGNFPILLRCHHDDCGRLTYETKCSIKYHDQKYMFPEPLIHYQEIKDIRDITTKILQIIEKEVKFIHKDDEKEEYLVNGINIINNFIKHSDKFERKE